MQKNLLAKVIKISKEAGQKILEVYNDYNSFTQIDMKANNSPLTLADKVSNELISKRLHEISPEIPILSEEGKEMPYEERSKWSSFWLVDPLDGTKEFIKRNGEFTVNIALVQFDRPVLGVVHIPVKDTIFFSEKGRGSFVTRIDTPSRSIYATPLNMTKRGLRIVCSRSHMSPEVEEYIKRFDSPQIVSMGSSLKFMLIAEGEADIYPRLSPTMEWDTAAAQIILEEAGGSVINQETQKPLQYNKRSLLNPHFIAFGNKTKETA